MMLKQWDHETDLFTSTLRCSHPHLYHTVTHPHTIKIRNNSKNVLNVLQNQIPLKEPSNSTHTHSKRVLHYKTCSKKNKRVFSLKPSQNNHRVFKHFKSNHDSRDYASKFTKHAFRRKQKWTRKKRTSLNRRTNIPIPSRMECEKKQGYTYRVPLLEIFKDIPTMATLTFAQLLISKPQNRGE